MKVVIDLHPVLSEELIAKMGSQFTDYSFEYDCVESKNKLITEPIVGQEHIQSKLTIRDELDNWNCDSYNLILNRNVTIQNPIVLFGMSGIAGQNSEIGTAVVWTSKPSNQRGIFIGDSFTLSKDKIEMRITGEFPKGTIRDRFELKTVLYIKKSGEHAAQEGHLAQRVGYILGEFDETVIYLKGNGSIFPVFTVQEKGPLWRVECKWEDPRSDSFDDEHVRIILNESHPDYKLVESSDLKRISPLMKEIIASSIQIIITKVRAHVDIQDIIDGKDVESGSICMAIQYFIQTFELNVNSPEDLASSMRDYLDGKIGGIM